MIQRTYSELNMDMLVFENRNQSYGAFEIRRVYNSHIRNSLIIAIFLSAGVFGGLYLVNQRISASTIASIKPDIEVLISPEDIKTMTYHPEAVKPAIQNPVVTPVTQAIENTNYKAVDDPVTDIIPTLSNPAEVSSGKQALTGIGEATGFDATSSPAGSTIETSSNEVGDFAEIMPAFKGGDAELRKFIIKNTVYPNKMIAQGIYGKVYVSFVIEKDGSINMIQIYKGVSEELDAEALRVISKMPSWTPGMQNGNPVRVKRIIPISFSLN